MKEVGEVDRTICRNLSEATAEEVFDIYGRPEYPSRLRCPKAVAVLSSEVARAYKQGLITDPLIRILTFYSSKPNRVCNHLVE